MGKCPQPITITEEETTVITPIPVRRPSSGCPLPINNNNNNNETAPVVTKLPSNKKPIKL